jgi:phosphoserine phosphatase RsbU/P
MSDTLIEETTELTYSEKQQLEEQIKTLQKELNDLRVSKVALESQNAMLDNLVLMAETPELEDMLQITIEQALVISNNLTGAEHSCLVLLTEKGKVKDTIINHKNLSPDEEKSLKTSASNQTYIDWVCRHQKIVLLSDAKNSHRWETLPGVPEVAGTVLSVPILKGKTVMGVLTLVHSKVNYFNSDTANLMQTVAKQISLALEFARFYGELETYSHALQIEVDKGREMQRNFLPDTKLDLPGWDVDAFFKPAKRMAGDFYDTFTLPNGLAALVIGDVCDKGVGAALFMGLFRSLLRIFSGQFPGLITEKSISDDPEDIDAMRAVINTNNYIAQNHGNLNMFATLFFGLLNPETGVITYINGGHEAPVILRANGTLERIKSTGPIVGPIDGSKFKVLQERLFPGDTLIGFTDGLTDARSPSGKFFTEKRVISLIAEAASTLAVINAESMISYLQNEVESHVDDADPFDDITMLAVHRAEAVN